MAGKSIPPSIFSTVEPFSSGQPASSAAADAWRLMGRTSWPDKLSPAMDWHPDSGGLPSGLPSLPMPLEEPSFGLQTIQSKQSLGEHLSMGSKQMALSVLDILNTKPPGPREDAAPGAPSSAAAAAAAAAAGSNAVAPRAAPAAIPAFEIDPLSLPEPPPLSVLGQAAVSGGAAAPSAAAAASAFSFPAPPHATAPFGSMRRQARALQAAAAEPHVLSPAMRSQSMGDQASLSQRDRTTSVGAASSEPAAWPERQRRSMRAAAPVHPLTDAPPGSPSHTSGLRLGCPCTSPAVRASCMRQLSDACGRCSMTLL